MGMDGLHGQSLPNGFWPPVNANGFNGAGALDANPFILDNQPNLGGAVANTNPTISTNLTFDDAFIDLMLQAK